MTRSIWMAAAATASLAATAATAETKRELDAHVHGLSSLEIAVEGDRVEMRLDAPGFDIVGFEHEAKSDADKAAIAAAKETLKNPLALFDFVGGGCSVDTAEVTLHAEDDHDHGHDDHGHDDHGDADHGHDDHGHDDHGDADHGHDDHAGEAKGADTERHTEFEATYSLTCAAIDAVASIDAAGFFASFDSAREVEIALVSDRGQRRFEAERDAAAVDLGEGL